MGRQEDVASAVEAALDIHRCGPFVWGRRDCVTLVEAVLAAHGIHADFKGGAPDLCADTHEESVRRSVAKHGSLGAMLTSKLDAVPDLERVESVFDWLPGMVGVTPATGTLFVGRTAMDAAALGSVAGVVGATPTRPWVMTLDRGLMPVSNLWPRWKPRMRLTVGG